jgi:hypothetical protein
VGVARGAPKIAALGAGTIFPGGEPCTKAYLRAGPDRRKLGRLYRALCRSRMSPEEILNRPLEVTKRDPYPIGQRPFLQNEG